MRVLRTLIYGHKPLAALLLALALCMKVLIPNGYMVGGESRTVTLQICAESAGEHAVRSVAIPAKSPEAPQGGKVEGMCAFSVLGHAAMPGANPILLAAAIAFVLALGFTALDPPLATIAARLRPPLRGPPAIA